MEEQRGDITSQARRPVIDQIKGRTALAAPADPAAREGKEGGKAIARKEEESIQQIGGAEQLSSIMLPPFLSRDGDRYLRVE